jgi:protein-tyrosine phosphatase
MFNTNLYDEIVSHLFVGSADALVDASQFSLIINCTHDIRILGSVRTIRIPINDVSSDSYKLVDLIYNTGVLKVMHEYIKNNKKVLVHCFAGIQRSCTLVACYLIQYHDMTPFTALEYIRQKRPIAFFGHINLLNAIELFYVNRAFNQSN